ncbi:hypothetical protein ABG768_023518, partial [Culter alburnus]
QRTTFINYSAVAAQQRAEKVSLRTDGCRLSVLMERRLEVDRSVSRHVNLHDVFVLEGERFPPSGHRRLKLELEVHRCCWENFPTDHYEKFKRINKNKTLECNTLPSEHGFERRLFFLK